jgi:hypothetical protein
LKYYFLNSTPTIKDKVKYIYTCIKSIFVVIDNKPSMGAIFTYNSRLQLTSLYKALFMIKKIVKLSILTLIVSLVGCATQVTEQPTETKRASVKAGDFKKIILVASEIAPIYAEHGANIKAVNKIDEILATRITGSLDNVTVIKAEQLEESTISASQKGDILIIKPYVKQIKFIGGAARFWAGAMAGSSVVILDVILKDAATGEVIGKTGSYRRAGAYADPFGIGSNRMLEDAAQDIINYISANQ